MMRGGVFRAAMRPGFGALARRGVGRPIGVFPDRYGTPGVTLWHWSCRLDCWAALTSGWYLPDQGAALEEGLAHLRAYHFLAACMRVPCDGPHSLWSESSVEEIFCEAGCPTHLRGWRPVTPLSQKQVTLRA